MTREITLSRAVNEAIAEEMRRDPAIFLIGEDVAEAGTPFKVLSGLVEEFGPERIIDTPISEPGFMGMAVGAADMTSDDAKAFFAAAYPDDALDKLWWWPIQESWFVAKRNEYQDRFLSA